MHRIVYLLLVVIVFSSCSHRIVRTGYDIKKSDHVECDVLIKKDTVVSADIATQVGEVKLGETGFSVACSEKHAIKILKGEACAINADLIIITEEKRADFWSSCYRGRAKFYRFNENTGNSALKSDDDFDPKNVKKRVKKDRAKTVVITAVLAGVFGVLFLL